MAYHYINGVAIPYPKRGVTPTVTTVVNSGRNLKAVVVGQRVGRDQYKMDSLEFPWLSAEEWSKILRLTSSFFFNYTFLDPVTNSWITVKCYCGDRTAEPYWVDENGRTTWYRNCRVNIIDTGK